MPADHEEEDENTVTEDEEKRSGGRTHSDGGRGDEEWRTKKTMRPVARAQCCSTHRGAGKREGERETDIGWRGDPCSSQTSRV